MKSIIQQPDVAGEQKELLPCPFCGCNVVQWSNSIMYHPREDCILRARNFSNDAWNKRSRADVEEVLPQIPGEWLRGEDGSVITRAEIEGELKKQHNELCDAHKLIRDLSQASGEKELLRSIRDYCASAGLISIVERFNLDEVVSATAPTPTLSASGDTERLDELSCCSQFDAKFDYLAGEWLLNIKAENFRGLNLREVIDKAISLSPDNADKE